MSNVIILICPNCAGVEMNSDAQIAGRANSPRDTTHTCPECEYSEKR